MHRKSTLVALLLAAVALFAGACGSDSDESSDTTAKKTTTTTEAAAGDDETDTETTNEVSDEEFEAAITEFTDAVEAADGDACLVFAAVGSQTDFPDPANPAQVEVALRVYDVMFGAITASAPPEFATQAQVITDAGEQLQADGAANDYEPEWFLEAVGTAFSEGEVAAALDTYFEQTQAACVPDGAAGTTVPG